MRECKCLHTLQRTSVEKISFDVMAVAETYVFVEETLVGVLDVLEGNLFAVQL